MPASHPLVWLLATAAMLCPAVAGQAWLVDVQESNGRWSAYRFGGERNADILVTGLMTLALLADGATPTPDRLRHPVWAASLWLLERQDAAGRIGLRADPDWFLDHAVAACALAESLAAEPRPALVEPVRRAVAATHRHVAMVGPRLRPEELLWCRILVDAAAAAERQTGQLPGGLTPLGTTSLGELLATVVPRPVTTDRPREAAAAFALDSWNDRATGQAPAPAWPDSPAADPLTCCYLGLGLYRRGEIGRIQDGLRLQSAARPWLELTRQGAADHPECDPRMGHAGTAAAGTLLRLLEYRCCRLAAVGQR